MKITFCGATEGVTGSNYLLETNSGKLIIDCGLFQGGEEETRLNWNEFPYNPSEPAAMIMTHSHIDHIGRTPVLVKKGFKGTIYTTEPTKEFAAIFLEDSCHLMANEAEGLNLPPLYEVEDVENTIALVESKKYHEKFSPLEGVEVEFFDAGHILGSSITKITAEGQTIIFSGDLGNPPVPILRATEAIESADVVVMESTYGDREHEPMEKRKEQLIKIIKDSLAEKGTILMPSFAMERTQEILYELNGLVENGEIPFIPVYLDSPLAIKATEVYEKFPEYYNKEASDLMKSGDDFFAFKGLKMIEESQDSMKLDRDDSPKIIIAGSGMSNGGRIQWHEKAFLPKENTTLLIVGYQVKGTLGRRLLDGEKELRIRGSELFCKAKIIPIQSYSAHADQPKLVEWVSKINNLKKIVLTHGEPEAKTALSAKIKEKMNIEIDIPKNAQSIELSQAPKENNEI
jgi:metallo-beta-lactamase family protein